MLAVYGLRPHVSINSASEEALRRGDSRMSNPITLVSINSASEEALRRNQFTQRLVKSNVSINSASEEALRLVAHILNQQSELEFPLIPLPKKR